MYEALIGLVSAVAVVVVKGLIDYIMDRRKRKDTVEDRQEEKTDEEKNILKAIHDVADTIDKISGELTTVKDEVAGLKTAIGTCQSRIESVDRKADMGRIVEARVRILRFADEIEQKKTHSHEHFNQIMGDIEDYEDYCDSHPEFKNNITRCSAQIIKDTYLKLRAEGNFYKEGQ